MPESTLQDRSTPAVSQSIAGAFSASLSRFRDSLFVTQLKFCSHYDRYESVVRLVLGASERRIERIAGDSKLSQDAELAIRFEVGHASLAAYQAAQRLGIEVATGDRDRCLRTFMGRACPDFRHGAGLADGRVLLQEMEKSRLSPELRRAACGAHLESLLDSYDFIHANRFVSCVEAIDAHYASSEQIGNRLGATGLRATLSTALEALSNGAGTLGPILLHRLNVARLADDGALRDVDERLVSELNLPRAIQQDRAFRDCNLSMLPALLGKLIDPGMLIRRCETFGITRAELAAGCEKWAATVRLIESPATTVDYSTELHRRGLISEAAQSKLMNTAFAAAALSTREDECGLARRLLTSGEVSLIDSGLRYAIFKYSTEESIAADEVYSLTKRLTPDGISFPNEKEIAARVLADMSFTSALPPGDFTLEPAALARHMNSVLPHARAEADRLLAVFGAERLADAALAAEAFDIAPQARAYLLSTVARRGGPEHSNRTREALVSDLDSDSPIVRKLAGKQLSVIIQYKPAAAEELIQRLLEKLEREGQDETGKLTRSGAAVLRALAAIRTAEIDAALLNRALDSKTPAPIRGYIVRMLADGGSPLFGGVVARQIQTTALRTLNLDNLKLCVEAQRISSKSLREGVESAINRLGSRFLTEINVTQLHRDLCPAIPRAYLPLLLHIGKTQAHIDPAPGREEEIIRACNACYRAAERSSEKELVLQAIQRMGAFDRTAHVEHLLTLWRETRDGTKSDWKHVLDITRRMQLIAAAFNLLTADEERAVVAALKAKNTPLESRFAEANRVGIAALSRTFGGTVSPETIGQILSKWSDPEALIVYGAHLSLTKSRHAVARYYGSIVARFDPETNYRRWKESRYQLGASSRPRTIRHLSNRQLDVWQREIAVELPAPPKAPAPTDVDRRSALLFTHLSGAHAEGTLATRHPAADAHIGQFFGSSYETLAERRAAADRAVRLIDAELEELTRLLAGRDAVKLNALAGMLETEPGRAVSGRAKSLLTTARRYLPELEEVELVRTRSVGELCSAMGGAQAAADRLRERAAELTAACPEHHRAAMASRYSFSPDDIFAPARLASSLGTARRLIQLAAFGAEEVPVDGVLPLRPYERLARSIVHLRRDLRDDRGRELLRTAEELLGGRPEHTAERGPLALVISDNPELLINAGRYPSGKRSCQNWSDGSGRDGLLAVLNDAHIRVAYVVDVGRLSSDFVQLYRAQGPQALLSEIPPKAILEASVSRTVLKAVKGGGGFHQAAVFVAPDYTQTHCEGAEFDERWLRALHRELIDPMGAHGFRGDGPTKLDFPASGSPTGQYEDGIDGAVDRPGLGIKRGRYSIKSARIEV